MRGWGIAAWVLAASLALLSCSSAGDEEIPVPDSGTSSTPGPAVDAGPKPDARVVVDAAPEEPDAGLSIGECDPECDADECCTALGQCESLDSPLCQLPF